MANQFNYFKQIMGTNLKLSGFMKKQIALQVSMNCSNLSQVQQ